MWWISTTALMPPGPFRGLHVTPAWVTGPRLGCIPNRRALVRGNAADVAGRGWPGSIRGVAQGPLARVAAGATRGFLCVEHALFGGHADLSPGPVAQQLLQLAIWVGSLPRPGVWRGGAGFAGSRARATRGSRGGGVGRGHTLADPSAAGCV